MCDTFSTRRTPMLLRPWIILLLANHIVQAYDLQMSPKLEKDEQVIKAGSTLKLTCIEKIYYRSERNGTIKWTIPTLTKRKEEFRKRHHVESFKNETQLISTMILTNATNEDTGYYSCQGTSEKSDRYIYVTSNEKRFFIDDVDKKQFKHIKSSSSIVFVGELGKSFVIPFKTTHPDLSISVFKESTDIKVEPKNEFIKIWDSSSPVENSKWSFNHRQGLKLEGCTIFDTTDYYFVGSMPEKVGENRTASVAPHNEVRKFYTWNRSLKQVDRIDVLVRIRLIVPGMELKRVGDPSDPVEGSNVILTCTVSSFNPSRLAWSYYGHEYRANSTKPKLVQGDPKLNSVNSSTIRTAQRNGAMKQPKDIIITSERKWNDLFYHTSRVTLINVTLDSKYTKFECISFEVHSISKEISFGIKEINNDPVSNTVASTEDIAQNLICHRLSQHVPIQWLKDGKPYTGAVKETATASVVQLRGKETECGNYECRWTNSKGEPRHRNFRVKSVSFDIETNIIVIFCVTLTIGLLATGVGIGIKFYFHKKNVEKELGKWETILNGDPSKIDPDVPMEYQTEFLPYDKKWEFPRKRLRLGQELGSGFFGRVVKAEAVGLKDSEETVTTVAVKMIKPTNNSDAALEALIGELKIMIYLGSHLNLVNFIGACTKTTVKEEILVIIDYCRFGNLKSFLFENRDKFVNELNGIGTTLPAWNVTATTSRTQHQPSPKDVKQNFLSIVNKVMKCQPGELANETGKTRELGQTTRKNDTNSNAATANQIIITSDLISWALQIARGMEFMADKNVLHGDLAARNVLLADHGIVKVADFGMARKMKNHDYKKNGDELMPVKWMAIESLTDKIFSSQSDVWSYGVVLWEIFTLGKVPYPGIDYGLALVTAIQNGHRMEKPKFAPDFFGDIMKSCWQKDPKERPTFLQLAEAIEEYIESLVSIDYLNIN
ncbi:vascular endothelial growth factor receptor 1-like [Daphnia pulex]|uniref:vascular endothelial growth factor receptor 1-like n=1 Tax=Daphnia pulex TaxID=6669 RepID=UPI001EE1150E|nr:vascular endothelial growth factor receptor 1-like [Daphnia pulex]